MGLQVFSTMPAVVESLLTNRPEVASQCLVLLIGMFTDVMLLEVLPSLKASVAHLTRKAARLTTNCLSKPHQCLLASECLGAKVAHGRLSVSLGRRRGWRQRQVSSHIGRTSC